MASVSRKGKRGGPLEDHVADLLAKEYERVSAQRFFAAQCLQQGIFSQQVNVGTNIYGNRRTVDFILYHPRRWPNCLVLQCKWQTSSGSVDEKYPFEVECIAQGRFETIIVLDGGGYSRGARQWLLAQRGKRNLVDVCNRDEIQRMQTEGRL